MAAAQKLAYRVADRVAGLEDVPHDFLFPLYAGAARIYRTGRPEKRLQASALYRRGSVFVDAGSIADHEDYTKAI
jgi:hypothetical protein